MWHSQRQGVTAPLHPLCICPCPCLFAYDSEMRSHIPWLTGALLVGRGSAQAPWWGFHRESRAKAVPQINDYRACLCCFGDVPCATKKHTPSTSAGSEATLRVPLAAAVKYARDITLESSLLSPLWVWCMCSRWWWAGCPVEAVDTGSKCIIRLRGASPPGSNATTFHLEKHSQVYSLWCSLPPWNRLWLPTGVKSY